MSDKLKKQRLLNIATYAVFFWGLLIASFFAPSEIFKAAAIVASTITFVVTEARKTIELVIEEKLK